MPLAAGPLSDRTRSRLGARRPWLLAALPFMVAALVLVSVAGSLWASALVLGGLLLGLARPLPFVLAAGIVAAGGVAVVLLAGGGKARRGARHPVLRIVRGRGDIRLFLLANTGWETTFAGMRTFVVLYVTRGLGDLVGIARVVLVASVVYGAGLLAGGVPRSWHWAYLGLVFVVAIAAGAVMTLAWGLLYELMPDRDQGAVSALGTMTKGIGIVAGPLIAGAAIDLTSNLWFFSSTDGYAAMWAVLAVPVLASIPIVRRLARVRRRESGLSRVT